MIEARFRPLPIWPHDSTPGYKRCGRYVFKASWQNTLDLLDRGLRQLKARDIMIGCGLREEDLRLDGWPRSGAREPSHPGVEISFTTQHGRLVYATDVCKRWEHNIRAIALGLEALELLTGMGSLVVASSRPGSGLLISRPSSSPRRPRDRSSVEHGREERCV